MKKIAIVGYGKLGQGIDAASSRFPDLEIERIFTRRDPRLIASPNGTAVTSYDRIMEYKGNLDCLILATGSSSDLPHMSPELAGHFNIVDSFDNHGKIFAHLKAVDKTAAESGHTALISFGWDPGLLSLVRLLSEAFMPYANVGTLWGRGVSQGHSEVLRRIDGVRLAVEYTEPKESAVQALLSGSRISATEGHRRVCYIVADEEKYGEIENAVRACDGYFKGYDTEINFIGEDEFRRNHTAAFHSGRVIASGAPGGERALLDLRVDMDSNPSFTANILLAAARAAIRLSEIGESGAKTVFDVPPKFYYRTSPLILL